MQLLFVQSVHKVSKPNFKKFSQLGTTQKDQVSIFILQQPTAGHRDTAKIWKFRQTRYSPARDLEIQKSLLIHEKIQATLRYQSQKAKQQFSSFTCKQRQGSQWLSPRRELRLPLGISRNTLLTGRYTKHKKFINCARG